MRYIIILCLLFSTNLHAEIILDGSLGQQIELAGPEYAITEALGSRAGNNLFHSFESFNLSEGEIATFSGSDDIYNVISRVTGGEPSLIDGTIASSMPDAFFYFINPYGIAFGPNSSLDVLGSFHSSTAHILRFPDGNDFDTVNTENTLLSIEDPSAFGFLSNDVAPISVQQAQLAVNPF
jgi:filamentous hemagglutinin family protein